MHEDYVDYPATATSEEVIGILQKGGIDADGYSAYRWYKRLFEREIAFELVEYVLKNRTEPKVTPMFNMIVTDIKKMLNED